jgi:hypothetical protein
MNETIPAQQIKKAPNQLRGQTPMPATPTKSPSKGAQKHNSAQKSPKAKKAKKTKKQQEEEAQGASLYGKYLWILLR